MKLKVIKAIKGLVPGDILEYNEKEDSYDIFKVEENITENGSNTKRLKVSIGSWLVDNYKQFFAYIDDEGNTIQVEELTYDESPKAKEESTKSSPIDPPPTSPNKAEISEIDILKKQIEDLQRVVDSYRVYVYKPIDYYYNYNPFRTYWSW